MIKNRIKIIIKVSVIAAIAGLFVACSSGSLSQTVGESIPDVMAVEETTSMGTSDPNWAGTIWVQISREEAARIMAEETGYLIVDVRRPDEYAEGHIPEAINVPNESIGTEEIPELPDKDQTLLIYCRSGRRSKEAAEKLARLGYSEVREFGGIITWEGETVTDDGNQETVYIHIDVNGRTLSAVLEDNSSAQALAELLGNGPLTLELSDFSNFEKVGPLPESLPTNDEPLDTDAGDLILYQGNKFVMYYDKNSWTFTKLGHLEDITKQELKELLGEGDVTVVLSLAGED